MPRKKKEYNMHWLVWSENVNAKRIEIDDIFDHSSFKEYVVKHLKKCETKEEFAENLRKELMYYFWCKCEHEIIISGWPPTKDGKEARKIDIYTQVHETNWDVFVDYVWSFK